MAADAVVVARSHGARLVAVAERVRGVFAGEREQRHEQNERQQKDPTHGRGLY